MDRWERRTKLLRRQRRHSHHYVDATNPIFCLKVMVIGYFSGLFGHKFDLFKSGLTHYTDLDQMLWENDLLQSIQAKLKRNLPKPSSAWTIFVRNGKSDQCSGHGCSTCLLDLIMYGWQAVCWPPEPRPGLLALSLVTSTMINCLRKEVFVHEWSESKFILMCAMWGLLGGTSALTLQTDMITCSFQCEPPRRTDPIWAKIQNCAIKLVVKEIQREEEKKQLNEEKSRLYEGCLDRRGTIVHLMGPTKIEFSGVQLRADYQHGSMKREVFKRKYTLEKSFASTLTAIFSEIHRSTSSLVVTHHQLPSGL